MSISELGIVLATVSTYRKLIKNPNYLFVDVFIPDDIPGGEYTLILSVASYKEKKELLLSLKDEAKFKKISAILDPHSLEKAKKIGKATGLVSDTRISHFNADIHPASGAFLGLLCPCRS